MPAGLQISPSLPTFDVTAFGAVGDVVVSDNGSGVITATGTDDTTAITAALTAASSSGGGTVYFPGQNKYGVTMDLYAYDNVTIRGDSKMAATVVALSGFGINSLNRAAGAGVGQNLNGAHGAILNMDGPAGAHNTPLQGFRVIDLGFDPRPMVNRYDAPSSGVYGWLGPAIFGDARGIQHCFFDNLHFELGFDQTAQFGTNKGLSAHAGIMLLDLGNHSTYAVADQSFDFHFRNISSNNGYATILLAGSPYRNWTIDGVRGAVQGSKWIDDIRVGVTGGNPNTGPNFVQDFSVKNVQVFVGDEVTQALVDGVSIAPGANTTIRDFTVDDVHYHGSSAGVYSWYTGNNPLRGGTGSPLYIGNKGGATAGYVQEYSVRNITGKYSYGITLEVNQSPADLSPFASADGIILNECYDPKGGVIINAREVPANQSVHITNLKVHFNAAAATGGGGGGPYIPSDVLLTGSGGTYGLNQVSINNGVFANTASGSSTNVVSIIGGVYKNVKMRNLQWDVGSLASLPAGTAGYVLDMQGCSNNITGLLPSQPSVPASGVALANPYPFDCMVAVYNNVSEITSISVGTPGSLTQLSDNPDGVAVLVKAGESISGVYVASSTHWKWLGAHT